MALLATFANADDGPAAFGPPAATAHVGSACAPAVRRLLAHQRADGSFGTTTRLQTTAFVVIALADEQVVARTAEVRRALRRSVEFLTSCQVESGAFVEGERDHTVLALLALLAMRDGSRAEPPPTAFARSALPLLPREVLAHLSDPRSSGGDADLVRAAWSLARRE